MDGQSLRLPTDVAVNSERQILVADSGNNRVVLASVQGEWLAVFGSSSDSGLDPVTSRLMQVSKKCTISSGQGTATLTMSLGVMRSSRNNSVRANLPLNI